ncbi:hypothetical protein OD350_29275 (plasmid) [Clostridium beijerinckii]|uniref:hypothetical protein n=1 Tax=Clostridium beijerinckii TaxID=1520 RepID=UPI0022279BF8|nr:hypothetical protein [Clostridium beijerinckii]UYZ38981.1 hypothetical protein OD350_29275 [Clostridium beijerinckii]
MINTNCDVTPNCYNNGECIDCDYRLVECWQCGGKFAFKDLIDGSCETCHEENDEE